MLTESESLRNDSVSIPRAADGTRTHDLVLTKDALYQLSYSSPSSRPSLARLSAGFSLEHVLHLLRTVPMPCALLPRPFDSPQQVLANDSKRVKGIEPSSLAWKAMALPLSYTRVARRTADRRHLDTRLQRRHSPSLIHSSTGLVTASSTHFITDSLSMLSGGCRIRTCEGIAIRFTV